MTRARMLIVITASISVAHDLGVCNIVVKWNVRFY